LFIEPFSHHVWASQVLQRVDLHVAAVRVHAMEHRALLDHPLEEVDQVGLGERPVAERLALRLGVVERFAQLARALGVELCDADEPRACSPAMVRESSSTCGPLGACFRRRSPRGARFT
jgi:hypothetical protein